MRDAVLKKKIRKNSIGICGGTWGDEGKAKVLDQIKGTIFYRDNGGGNAGHTIELNDGKKIVLHHLPSGIAQRKATVVLGKEMVIHPKELIYEIKEAKKFFDGKIAKVKIDENALLCLDTHRAYEGALKKRESGSKGSTGRGIGPAYVDEINRNALRMKDLLNFDEKKIREHYRFYKDQIKGLGFNIDSLEIPFLDYKGKFNTGKENVFVKKLKEQAKILKPFIGDIYDFLKKNWENEKISFVFEKAQAVGLDKRWGVYPDITSSNTCFDGILSSTYGIIDPEKIEFRIGVIKATYASSVGSRKLPTMMDSKVAEIFREYGNEYGATTHRPRDIVSVDLVALNFYAKMGKINYFAITHMDSVFPKMPIKVCTDYRIGKKKVAYRPFQDFLSKVKPVFTELTTWDREKVQKAKSFKEMPTEAKSFVRFVERNTGVKVMYLTNGPRRDQVIKI